MTMTVRTGAVEIFTAFQNAPKTPTQFVGESKTQQHFAEDCDINVIMERYTQTGVLKSLQGRGDPAQFGDFSNVGDYREALEKVQDADKRFMEYPSKVREYFGNDPKKLMDFLINPDLEKKMELGLMDKEERIAYKKQKAEEAAAANEGDPVDPAPAPPA